ncbi:hypothetical protein A3778_04370 [Lacticaseibacillus paracasei]|nr:hypothetical protein A3778_04370 [Lacticaseibacillus paracasei]
MKRLNSTFVYRLFALLWFSKHCSTTYGCQNKYDLLANQNLSILECIKQKVRIDEAYVRQYAQYMSEEGGFK